jgi:hypothetical protein
VVSRALPLPATDRGPRPSASESILRPATLCEGSTPTLRTLASFIPREEELDHGKSVRKQTPLKQHLSG